MENKKPVLISSKEQWIALLFYNDASFKMSSEEERSNAIELDLKAFLAGDSSKYSARNEEIIRKDLLYLDVAIKWAMFLHLWIGRDLSNEGLTPPHIKAFLANQQHLLLNIVQELRNDSARLERKDEYV